MDRATAADEVSRPALAVALKTWAYIGLNSFGGPAGQIAVIHREIVERRRWVTEQRFLHALNYCMLLPGPEAHQLAVYLGWLLNGARGGLGAGLLFIAPGVLTIMVLSVLYSGLRDTSFVQAIFYGIKPAVVAIVALAILAIGRRALRTNGHVAIALGAFAAIFFFDVSFPLVILGAAVAGLLIGRRRAHEPAGPAPTEAAATRPSAARALGLLAAGSAVWLVPVAALVLVLGPANVLSQLGVFFSTVAVLTFGGAYAVLAYVAQEAVAGYGWLSAAEMLDGLGMAESTPGPLIMVVQFVGFVAAFGRPGLLDPFVAGALGGLLVSWTIFVPSFIWIFVGAPYAEYLRERRSLSAALAGITAAVVGVIANLAAWLALQTLFGVTGELRIGPVRLHTVQLGTLDMVGLAIAVFAAVALVRLRWPLLLTLAASAMLGAGWWLLARGPAG